MAYVSKYEYYVLNIRRNWWIVT